LFLEEDQTMTTLATAWVDTASHQGVGQRWLPAQGGVRHPSRSVDPIRPTLDEGVVLSLVGGNLKRLRRQHRLSLEELSRLSGVSRAMLGQIEQGKSIPSIKTLWQVSQALGVPVGWFLEAGHDAQVLLLAPGSESPLALRSGEGEIRSLQQLGEGSRDAFYELRLGAGAVLSLPATSLARRVNLVVAKGPLLVEVDDLAHVVNEREALQYETNEALIWRHVGPQEAQAFVVIRAPAAAD
jgi:transcriptional regulator with XRE-family HTH domain